MINVLPAVTSLMFQDRVNVFRREEVMNNWGEGTKAEASITNVPAVVWCSGQNKLDRRPEAQSTTKDIEVIARFAFRAASKEGSGQTFQADLIEWTGTRYTVTKVDDYSQYGAGFTHAQATAQPVLQKGAQTK